MLLHNSTPNQKQPILVFGKLCSGKGTFSKRYIDTGYAHITTSDVVKRVSGAESRSSLQNTKHLDVQIADELINEIETNQATIIDGIRQISIVNRVLDSIGEDNVTLIWLEVPDEERERRYYDREDVKDDQSFDVAALKDSELGLGELEVYLKGRDDLLQVEYYYDNTKDRCAF